MSGITLINLVKGKVEGKEVAYGKKKKKKRDKTGVFHFVLWRRLGMCLPYITAWWLYHAVPSSPSDPSVCEQISRQKRVKVHAKEAFNIVTVSDPPVVGGIASQFMMFRLTCNTLAFPADGWDSIDLFHCTRVNLSFHLWVRWCCHRFMPIHSVNFSPAILDLWMPFIFLFLFTDNTHYSPWIK